MKDEENDSQGILVLKENEFWAFFSFLVAFGREM